MTYELIALEDDRDPIDATTDYRRTHYRVYDENGFLSTFASTPPENATLTSVSAHLCNKFASAAGTGYASKDMVVLFGSRIVAVVRKGIEGLPVVTTFETDP